jgi:hypothetical protein
MNLHDRMLGAVLVLMVPAAQTYWMGAPIILLSGGLILAYGVWSDGRFVTFNMLWLAAFVVAGLGVYRRVQLAYLVVIFLALIGGVGNGAPHLVLSAMYRRYFPGLITAPFCLLMGHCAAYPALWEAQQARPDAVEAIGPITIPFACGARTRQRPNQIAYYV